MEVRKILATSRVFDDSIVRQLLVRSDMNHLLLSDTIDLMESIQRGFPQIVEITDIGKTWQERPI